MNAMTLFKSALLVMLFYSFAITILTYSLPAEMLSYTTAFSEVGDNINLDETTERVQESLQTQQDLPVVEVGALVFYSGNLLLDLLGNFAFAFPQMLGALLNGISMLFQIDPILWQTVQIFASGIILIFYVIGLIQLVVGVRSGRLI